MGSIELYWHADASVAAAIVGCLAGWWVPSLIRRVPEPADSVAVDGQPPKEAYAAIAARRGLAWYTLVGTGAAAGVIGGVVGWPNLLVVVPLVPVAAALTIVDWRTRLLPRVLVLPATALAVVLAATVSLLTAEFGNLIRGLLGLLIARSGFWLMWRVHAAGMGFGDVRMAALVGFALAYLGWGQFVVGCYAGFLLLAVPGAGIALIKRDRSFLKTAVPFGPFMLAGALIGIVAGPNVTQYLGYG
ncbi:MAG: prepilin peptidase [Nocardioides sp.]